MCVHLCTEQRRMDIDKFNNGANKMLRFEFVSSIGVNDTKKRLGVTVQYGFPSSCPL